MFEKYAQNCYSPLCQEYELASIQVRWSRALWLPFLSLIIALSFHIRVEAAPASGQTSPKKQGELDNETVAMVNGESITRQQLANELINLFGEQILDDIIKRTLIEQEAKKQGVAITNEELQTRLEKEVEREINGVAKQAKLKDTKELDVYLQKRGKDLNGLRKDVADAVKPNVRIQLLAEKLVRLTIKISEEELKERFDDLYGEKIEARQIVVSDRAKSEEILAKLRAGADFAVLAAAESTDSVSRRHGGKMKPLNPKGTLGRSIASVPEGGLSDIISTEHGYHILQVLGRTEAKNVKFDDVRAELEEALIRERARRRLTRWFIALRDASEIRKNLHPGLAH